MHDTAFWPQIRSCTILCGMDSCSHSVSHPSVMITQRTKVSEQEFSKLVLNNNTIIDQSKRIDELKYTRINCKGFFSPAGLPGIS